MISGSSRTAQLPVTTTPAGSSRQRFVYTLEIAGDELLAAGYRFLGRVEMMLSFGPERRSDTDRRPREAQSGT